MTPLDAFLVGCLTLLAVGSLSLAYWVTGPLRRGERLRDEPTEPVRFAPSGSVDREWRVVLGDGR